MNPERDVSVEELYWDVPSGKTPAEMKGSRVGQREELSSDGSTFKTLVLPFASHLLWDIGRLFKISVLWLLSVYSTEMIASIS